jgi:flagellar biosynthetic protein FliR
MLAMLIFVAVDGHLLMISALADSFQALPIGDAPIAGQGWMVLVVGGGQIFASGLMLSLPLVTALLTINLAMGILNRASPQFSIFAVGFPLTLLAGIWMLQLLMPHLAGFLEPRFGEGIDLMVRVVGGLRG